MRGLRSLSGSCGAALRRLHAAEMFTYDAYRIIMPCHSNVKWITPIVALEDRTARLTILIDPRKKAVFERLCAEEDATPSQVVRRLIRAYIEERQGRPW